MAKRRVGRPRVKGGPRKMTDKAIKAYMTRGLTRNLKSASAIKAASKKKRSTSKKRGGGKRGLKKGHKKSASWIANISKGLKRAWKQGKFKNRKRRGGAKRRRGGARGRRRAA